MTYWYIVVKTIELKLFMYCKHKIYFILTLRRVLHAKFFINVDEKYCHFSIDALPIIMSIGSYRNWRKSDLALYLFKSYHKHNMLLGTNFWYHEIIAHNIYSHIKTTQDYQFDYKYRQTKYHYYFSTFAILGHYLLFLVFPYVMGNR